MIKIKWTNKYIRIVCTIKYILLYGYNTSMFMYALVHYYLHCGAPCHPSLLQHLAEGEQKVWPIHLRI